MTKSGPEFLRHVSNYIIKKQMAYVAGFARILPMGVTAAPPTVRIQSAPTALAAACSWLIDLLA